VTTPIRPILGNACAQAATAREARFRIDREIGGRIALIVALDAAAAEVVDRVAERPWGAARFFRSPSEVRLGEELSDADVAIMIGTADADAGAAATIASACSERGIMTAGLILGDRDEVSGATAALRPYARNLLITEDEDDVAAVLTALRA
jgi:hypothetical protein